MRRDTFTNGPTLGVVPCPRWLIEKVQDLIGKEFTLDAAADPQHHVCHNYITCEDDGLKQDWGQKVVWCNPPFNLHTLHLWVVKAIEAAEGGAIVAMLLPLWHGYEWYTRCVENGKIIHV